MNVALTPLVKSFQVPARAAVERPVREVRVAGGSAADVRSLLQARFGPALRQDAEGWLARLAKGQDVTAEVTARMRQITEALLPQIDAATERNLARADIRVHDATRLIRVVEDVPGIPELQERLASQATRKDIAYRLVVVKDDKFNARHLGAGHVRVTTGFLDVLKDESERAVVIAHEFAHGEQRTHLRREIHDRLVDELASWRSPASILRFWGPAADARAKLRAAAKEANLALARAEETGADQLGLRLAAGAGYDPRALPRVLERLAPAMQKRGGEHPPVEERIRAVKALLSP